MSRRNVSLVIVCEDQQQNAFVKRYLLKRGFERRRIREKVCPKGSQSGEQFVRSQLVREVEEYRRRRSYQHGLAIVAMIDADRMPIQDRLLQINSGLTQAGLQSIRPDESIAIFIPKRNIETWITFANNPDVDEDTVYPKLNRPRDCRNAVNAYIDTICRDGLPQNALPSLVHACHELEKIL